MNFIEFLGFIIALFAMTFLFAKRVSEERRRRLHPEEFQYEQDEQERAVQELLESLNIQVETPAKKTPPKPIPAPKIHKIKAAQTQASENLIIKELLSYHPHLKREASLAQKLVQQVPSAKDMVIYHEILSEPKGYKKF